MSLDVSVLLPLMALIASATSTLLENENVDTYLDISSQLVMVNSMVTVRNKYSEDVNKYVFMLYPRWTGNISYIEAYDIKTSTDLKVNKTGINKYDIWLEKAVPSAKSTKFRIFYVIINCVQSYPTSVTQGEKHYVLFSFNVFYYSAYFTREQKVLLALKTSDVTHVDGARYKLSDHKTYGLKYGEFFNKGPMSEFTSVIHYENSSPFLIVENVNRFVRISHWGYLSVWEEIKLVHSGPKFKGPFKREYSKIDAPQDTRIESFISTLPGDAFDIYIKDEIGLLYSFSIDDSKLDETKVIISPRFVMYGGWKTEYEIGYSLPISNYVSHDNNDRYTLTIPYIGEVFPFMVVNQAVTNIILPEEAEFQSVDPYFELENETSRYCYILDVTCRDVISFKTHNLVKSHTNIPVSLTYSYSYRFMLNKPLVIVTLIYFLLLIFIKFSSYMTTEEDLKTYSNKQYEASQDNKQNVMNPIKKKSKKILKNKKYY